MNVKEIKIKTKKYEIPCSITLPRSFNGHAVLFVHGWGASKKQFSKIAVSLAKEGYISVTFDMCGFGQSMCDLTTLSIDEHLKNILVVYKFIQKNPQVKKITIVGFSYGGFLTALLSIKPNIKSIVLHSPVIYDDKFIKKPLWEKKKILSWVYQFKLDGDFTGLEPIINISKFKGSLLCVGAEKDEISTQQVIKGYYNASQKVKNKKLTEIKGANHLLTNPHWQKEYLKILKKWLAGV